MSAAISLPVSQLVRRSDARQLDGKVVSAMAESIAAIGLLNPVRVRKAGEQYEVIAGAHRLSAADLGTAAISGEEHGRSPVATGDLGVKIGLHFVKRGMARVDKFNRFEWVPK